MRPIYMTLLILVSAIFFLVTCSKEVDPLIIEAESTKEDVKTEFDIFQDIKYRLSNFYFPLNFESNYLERMKLTYCVENEHIEFHYDYNTSELSGDDSSYVPSYIRLFVNNLDQHQTTKPQDGLFFCT